jgi:ABC-2 type transport system ATP-binding protein
VDPIARRQFWDLIYQLAERGTTVFVSTHYMEEAENCHRLALMHRGRLIALDTPAQLRAAAREPIVELHTEDSARTVEALKDTPGVVEAAMFGRAVHVTVSDLEEARTSIPALLATRGLRTDRFEPVTPSLEDVFVARVRAEGGAVPD